MPPQRNGTSTRVVLTLIITGLLSIVGTLLVFDRANIVDNTNTARSKAEAALENTSSNRTDVKVIRTKVERMEKDIEEIKRLLQERGG